MYSHDDSHTVGVQRYQQQEHDTLMMKGVVANAPSYNIYESTPIYNDMASDNPNLVNHNNTTIIGGGNDGNAYDGNGENPKSTRFIKFGSILLFIGTFVMTLFFMSDLIGGAQYYYVWNNIVPSPHNEPATSAAKGFLMIINLILLVMSGVFGCVSTFDRNSNKSKYSLLHVICLSLGMIVFLSEIVLVHISFFTTGYSIYQSNSYGAIFFPFLVVFTILSCCGLIACCSCCLVGCKRYADISAHTKEVSTNNIQSV